MDMNILSVTELQSLIGLSEDFTDRVLSRVSSQPVSSEFLHIYCLLLLERFDSAMPLVTKAMSLELNLQLLAMLQKSRFYLHRKAVPIAIRFLEFPQKKSILKASLGDEVCDVVKEAVATLRECQLFDSEELLDIAVELYKSRYVAARLLAVDVLVLVKESRFLLIDLMCSNCWRIRVRVATKFPEFGKEDRERILAELQHDHIDEVRIALSKHLKTLDFIEVLDDPNEFVRANYLANIADQVGDESILRRMLDDPCWEVKKILLTLKGDMFRKITIPLIRSTASSISWRIKCEILDLIEGNVENEFSSRLLMGFLIRNMSDKVYEVREKAQRILIGIVRRYNWVVECYHDLQALVTSTNYLHRVCVVPLAIEYDLRFGTSLGVLLANDAVVNVRERYFDCLTNRMPAEPISEIDPDTSFIET